MATLASNASLRDALGWPRRARNHTGEKQPEDYLSRGFLANTTWDASTTPLSSDASWRLDWEADPSSAALGVDGALNDTGSNGTTFNSSDYEYDYEISLVTFYWEELAPPLVVYALTYLVGVVGNALIIFTICRYRHLKTTTNVFLASLATADLLLILICIPVKLARLFSFSWTLGAFMCKLIFYLQTLSAVCSVLTLTVMSVERYYAIVYPMRAHYRCTISQAKKVCALIWATSVVLAMPILRLQVHLPVGLRVRAFWCVRDFDSPVLWRGYETYMLVLVLLVPACVMAAAYAAICRTILRMVVQRRSITGKGQMYWKTSFGQDYLVTTLFARKLSGADEAPRLAAPGSGASGLQVELSRPFDLGSYILHNYDDASASSQVVSMLVVVVVLFVVCWAPILVVNVLKAYAVLPSYSTALKHVVSAAELLCYCNSCVNPIVYGFMSRNFRESFRQVLCCRKRTPRASFSRQMSLSVTRTSILRYNTDSRNTFETKKPSVEQQRHEQQTLIPAQLRAQLRAELEQRDADNDDDDQDNAFIEVMVSDGDSYGDNLRRKSIIANSELTRFSKGLRANTLPLTRTVNHHSQAVEEVMPGVPSGNVASSRKA
ncbi:kiSS-1 receptor-like [Penaeus chinensis]|uniref:kiSS-1 receptor-like n=1 Tax=Penaeus chinensis TaxID=139456 RepID=UPI001FB6A46F|nr:kiSS-1 receptor-like [Penaeus chinensis]